MSTTTPLQISDRQAQTLSALGIDPDFYVSVFDSLSDEQAMHVSDLFNHAVEAFDTYDTILLAMMRAWASLAPELEKMDVRPTYVIQNVLRDLSGFLSDDFNLFMAAHAARKNGEVFHLEAVVTDPKPKTFLGVEVPDTVQGLDEEEE